MISSSLSVLYFSLPLLSTTNAFQSPFPIHSSSSRIPSSLPSKLTTTTTTTTQLILSLDDNNTKNQTAGFYRRIPKSTRITPNPDLNTNIPTPLLPIAETIDDLTDGWALSYADLHPETETSPAGLAFLATNVAYGVVGIILSMRGELTLGLLTELAGVASFVYHFSQLKFGQNRSEVRLALLTDYVFALTALVTGGVYLAGLGLSMIPVDVVVLGGVSVACLTLSWVWEFGYPYLFWHSMWHITSAFAGYLVGQAHLGEMNNVSFDYAIHHLLQ